ncbi:MAG: patatin-like phospholipase family protein [Cyanobacteria bacterium TGS_CYA1]|nr:patatin-like phospholipase family protein [Cyanobacteria bacterium TGS_CYA1]
MNNGTDYIRILSIDGGGVKGIIPCLILIELEKAIAKLTYSKHEDIALNKYFEMMAGTSTGGLVALGLTVPKPVKPIPNSLESVKIFHSATNLKDVYLNKSKEIFPNSGTALKAGDNFPRTVFGYAEALYPSIGLANVLKELFENAEFGQVRTANCNALPGKVLITSYDLTMRNSTHFQSWLKEHQDIKASDLGRATSAAPTFFPSKGIIGEFKDTEETKDTDRLHRHAFADGGLFANNPAMAAATKASTLCPDKKLIVLSLGTGSGGRTLFHEEVKYWGQTEWLEPMISTMFDAGSSATHKYIKEFSSIPDGKIAFYKRIDFELPSSLRPMDNAKNVPILNEKIAKELQDPVFQQQIEDIAQILVDPNRLKQLQPTPIINNPIEMRAEPSLTEEPHKYFWEATSRPRRALLFHTALALPIAVLLFCLIPVEFELDTSAYFLSTLKNIGVSLSQSSNIITLFLMLTIIVIGFLDVGRYCQIMGQDRFNAHETIRFTKTDISWSSFRKIYWKSRAFWFGVVGLVSLLVNAGMYAYVCLPESRCIEPIVWVSSIWILVFFGLSYAYIHYPLRSILFPSKWQFDYFKFEGTIMDSKFKMDLFTFIWTSIVFFTYPVLILLLNPYITGLEYDDWRFHFYVAFVLCAAITSARVIVHFLVLLEARQVGSSSNEQNVKLIVD